MPNVELTKLKKLSTFRRIALGTWRTEYDPTVYGSLALRMDKAVEYIQRFREKTGKHLTVTHLVGKALAAALETMPDANAILRFHQIYMRKTISLSFQVAMTEGEGEDAKMDLSVAKVEDVDKKSLAEIVDSLDATVDRVRNREDPALEQTRNTFRIIPTFMTHWVLHIMSFLGYALNLDLSWAGVPKDPFGSAMVTNIGVLGLECGYVPLVPYSRCPLLIAVGALNDEAVVQDGRVVVGKVMRLFATFDHRLMDGAHAAKLSKVVSEWLENPFEHFDPLD